MALAFKTILSCFNSCFISSMHWAIYFGLKSNDNRLTRYKIRKPLALKFECNFVKKIHFLGGKNIFSSIFTIYFVLFIVSYSANHVG